MLYVYPDFPKPTKGKNAILLRYGAYGDHIVASCVLPYLKRDGYRVTYNTTERGFEILNHNPNIDDFWLQKTDEIPNLGLDSHWKDVSKGFDKVVNLNQSIEVECVSVQFRDHYTLKQRREKFDINFYENNVKKAGYEFIPPVKGELYFTPFEHRLMKEFNQKKCKGKFKIVWCLAGSGLNKGYPWGEYVWRAFCSKYPDSIIITVGDELCRLLEVDSYQTIPRCSGWNIRQAAIACYHADLVISLDTGILHAAGCFDVPKIALLSVNTPENLTKYFENVTNLMACDCACYPCHYLIYQRQVTGLNGKTEIVCPVGNTGASECLEKIKPNMVIEAMEFYYDLWKSKRKASYA